MAPVQAQAGIEREVKIFLPLNSERQKLLSRCSETTEIQLTYFRTRSAKLLAREVLSGLGRLIVENQIVSKAELAQAEVKRTKEGAQFRFWLHLRRLVTAQGTVGRSSLAVPISKSAARRLKREPLRGRWGSIVLKSGGPVVVAGKRLDVEEFVSARLRKIRKPGRTAEYFLDFKGKRHGSHRISRAELSIKLTPERYLELVATADGGSLSKVRYHERGTVANSRGRAVPIELEIDVLRKTRRIGAFKPETALSFALVEIELPEGISRNTILKGITSGHHSFPILRGQSVLLSFRQRKEWEALGMRRLALSGLDESAQAVIAALEQRCRRKESIKKAA